MHSKSLFSIQVHTMVKVKCEILLYPLLDIDWTTQTHLLHEKYFYEQHNYNDELVNPIIWEAFDIVMYLMENGQTIDNHAPAIIAKSNKPDKRPPGLPPE